MAKVIEAPAVKTLGKLSLTIHKGVDFYDTQIIGKQDPVVKLKHGAVTHQTKVVKDGGKQGLWEETFTFNILRKGESIQLAVYASGVVTDSLIGLTFLDVDDLIKDPLPKFVRIGRDAKQSTDAGKVQISSHWAPTEAPAQTVVAGIPFIASGMPAPVTTKSGLAPLGFLPQNAQLNVDLAVPNAANLTGSWRVHEKGENGSDRSYSLELVHNPDGTLTGQGEAAHLTYKIAGEVIDGRVQYKETWDNEAIDRVDALIEENGRMFTCHRSSGAVMTARRLDSISKETHPLFFKFYYDLTGEWRVYYEYKEQKRSYSLFLTQHDGGRLTGHGEAGKLKYTVEGKLEKNVVSYTETWTGQGGKDEVLSTLNPAGSHFQCKTNHASTQEAKRVDAMTEGEKAHKYFLPFK